jgi:hypothetical protein
MDKREVILQRLVEIAAGLPGIATAVRNQDEISEHTRPAIAVFDADETADNLAMALLGDVETDADGNKVIDIFSRNGFEGELKYEGTNEIGPQMDITLFRVVFKPSKSLNPISDEWGSSLVRYEGRAAERRSACCQN